MSVFRWLFRRDPPWRARYLFPRWVRWCFAVTGVLVAYSQFVQMAFLHATRVVHLGVDTTAHWLIEAPVFVPFLFSPGGRLYWDLENWERVPFDAVPLFPDATPGTFVGISILVTMGSAGFLVAAAARTSWFFPRTAVALTALVGMATVPLIYILSFLSDMGRMH